MSDDTDPASGVAREVSPQPDGSHGVILRRTYRATIEDVWDACTDPERIRRWFLPISGDLREGGRFQFEGNAGGTVERCEPPTLVRATWEFGGTGSLLLVRLRTADGDTTQLEIEHIVPDDDHWRQFGPGAVGIGWDLATHALHELLAGTPIDPAAGAQWLASPDGQRRVTRSNAAWRDVHLASGAPPEDVTVAAERTLQAYTAP